MPEPRVEIPALPFGFARPCERDLGMLSRQIVNRADEALSARSGRAIWMIVPSLGAYLLFAAGVTGLAWALGINLEARALLLTATVAFLAMAGLGTYYRSEAGWTTLTGGLGRLQRMLLAQSLVLKTLTAFFFTMPRWALGNLLALFPRRARVDPVVLTLAAQLAAALDEPVSRRGLVSIMPRDIEPEVVDEAVVLLVWAGVVDLQHRSGRQVMLPAAGRDELLVILPAGVAGVTFVSELKRPTSSAPVAGKALVEDLVVEHAERPGWQLWLREKPLHALALFTGSAVIIAVAWVLIGSWMRQLSVDLHIATLPVSGVHGVSYDGERFVLAKDSEVELRTALDLTGDTRLSLLGLRRLWSGSGGMDNGTGELIVDFKRVDRALLDPSERYLLVHGTWDCRVAQRTRCATTDFAVVDVAGGTLFPSNLFKGLGAQAIKGWWDPGRLLAVRQQGSWQRGGGSRGSDNLAPEVVAVDVADGTVVSLHRPREQYFALAGVEGGERVFLAADREVRKQTGTVRFDFTEYLNFKSVNSFSISLRAYQPILREAQLDASGAYWVLSMEFPPPEMRPELGRKYSLWLVSRTGGGFTEVTPRQEYGMIFLDTFIDRGDSIVVYHREGSEPEFFAFRIEEY